MSHCKDPGNTKYVLDGHWFMQFHGNCLETRGKHWDLPKLALPIFKVMSSYFSHIHIRHTQIGR